VSSAAQSLEAGRLDAALADADSAITTSPERYRAYYVRGTIHEAMRQYEPAFEDYDAAERLYASDVHDGMNPKLLELSMSLAKIGVRIKQSKYDEARALIATLSTERGRCPLNDLCQGIADLASGDVQRARTEFATSPDGPWWRQLSACAFATSLLGERDEAQKLASAALEELRSQRKGVNDARTADTATSIAAMKDCIASGDRRGAIESFQRAEEFAVFPQALVDEWSK
jgi:tetratricopeptide (TPR) repeat protein